MVPHTFSFIVTLLLVFTSAIIGGVLAKRLKLPMVVGYIAAGVFFGNALPGITDRPFLELIGDVGVTLLLFTLGVEFSFHRLRRVLSTIAWAVILQVLLCLLLFLGVLFSLGFGFIPALYLAAAASLSSTAIVVKILSERGELDTVPGELATGWLVVQDLTVIPLMILLPSLSITPSAGTQSLLTLLLWVGISLLKAGLVIGVVIYLGRVGIGKLLHYVAGIGSREIFLIATIGVVFLAGLLAYSVGLSIALGAFIAGLLVAETSQNHTIFAEVRPLRDIFAVVFFVSLGMVLPVATLVQKIPLILLLTVIVVIVKWFFVLGLCRFLGYHRKTAFLVALSLTQISEFGFIIAREGVAIGAFTHEHYVLLVALTFSTILVSSPLVTHGNTFYYWLYGALGHRWPKIFPTKLGTVDEPEELPIRDHVVICGYGRVGKYIGRALQMVGITFLVVDYNHTTVSELREKGIQVIYGDPADRDVLDFAQVDFAKVLIIAIPDRHTQEMIIAHAQTLNRRIKIICRTHHEEDQAILKSLGVMTVVQPEFEAALSIVERLFRDYGVSDGDVSGKLSRLKIEHGMG